jgi:hypothetical protein
MASLFRRRYSLLLAYHARHRQFRSRICWGWPRIVGAGNATHSNHRLYYRDSSLVRHISWCSRKVPDAKDYLGGLSTNHLTSRCSRRLADFLPAFVMIKILPELARRALARRR